MNQVNIILQCKQNSVMPKHDKAKVYKLPNCMRTKKISKKAKKLETVKTLKSKSRDHNARVKGFLHIKLTQKKADLFRDVKTKSE